MKWLVGLLCMGLLIGCDGAKNSAFVPASETLSQTQLESRVDGIADPIDGLFSVEGTVFYGAGGHYCGFISWETFLQAMGRAPVTRALLGLPYQMIYDGVCQVTPRPYSTLGYFKYRGTAYHLSPDGYICRFASMAQYLATSGPDINTLNEPAALSLDPQFYNGNCLVRSLGYANVQSGDSIIGWAFDPNDPRPITIHVYADAYFQTFVGATTTNIPRPDVNNVYSVGGTHGFEFPIPQQYNVRGQPLFFYALSNSGTTHPLIGSIVVGQNVPARIAINRVYHPGTGDHNYSFNPNEGSSLGYRNEGAVFALYATHDTGLLPVYVCYKDQRPNHYLTTSRDCGGNGLLERTLGYVKPVGGSSPLYHCRHSDGRLLDTLYKQECLNAGFLNEGIIGFTQ